MLIRIRGWHWWGAGGGGRGLHLSLVQLFHQSANRPPSRAGQKKHWWAKQAKHGLGEKKGRGSLYTLIWYHPPAHLQWTIRKLGLSNQSFFWYAWMHWPFTCQQSAIWPIRSWYQNLFSLTGDIKTKSTGYPSLFSHPPPTPLWSQFTGYCLTSWENACPHGQPSFSPTLCYCHHLICTQVTVSRPCPLSEFYINKAS